MNKLVGAFIVKIGVIGFFASSFALTANNVANRQKHVDSSMATIQQNKVEEPMKSDTSHPTLVPHYISFRDFKFASADTTIYLHGDTTVVKYKNGVFYYIYCTLSDSITTTGFFRFDSLKQLLIIPISHVNPKIHLLDSAIYLKIQHPKKSISVTIDSLHHK